jgi:NitT/TauT family transport system substrate-binding protein
MLNQIGHSARQTIYQGHRGIGRRALLAAGTALLLPVRAGAAPPQVRLGVLQFGSVLWVADVIRRHGLDTSNGFALTTTTLANNDASRVALMADAADVVVSDWFFVASQRAAGNRLTFTPFSGASGGIMVPSNSPIRSLADLANRRLGVAGGPLDKSWLIVQAAARSTDGIDLATAAKLTYGAPPLLDAMLQRNDMDAVLTFWNFAARLDAAGFRQAVSVGDCARTLGLSDRISLIGYTFHEDWAKQSPAAIKGFLTASAAALDIMATSDAEWDALRPLMGAPDGALFRSLRQRFVDGIPRTAMDTQQRDAAKLFEIVRHAGGARVTDGLDALPDGVFWQPTNG